MKKTVNQTLKHEVNRCVLSLRLNECKLSASRTAADRQFHTTGPATEKAVTKSRSCPWNSVIAAGRRAETSPCRITVARLHRIGEVVWVAACVDCEHHQCQLELDSVHDGQPV